MTVKIDISKLNDLRKEVSRLLTEAQRLSSVNEKAMQGRGAAVPIVVVFFENTLTVCYRDDKALDDTEVSRISLKDAYEGPTLTRCDKYMAKIAAFLERRGLYQPRGAITNKTPNLFEDEKVKRVKV